MFVFVVTNASPCSRVKSKEKTRKEKSKNTFPICKVLKYDYVGKRSLNA